MTGWLMFTLMLGLGVLISTGAHYALAQMSGWAQLADRFATTQPISDPHADWYNLRMGRIVNGPGWFWLAPLVRYRRSVVVRINFRGIGLDRAWTAAGHKPIFIPWEAVKYVEVDDALPFPWPNKAHLFGHVVRVGIRPKSGGTPILITIGGHDLEGKLRHFAPPEIANLLMPINEKALLS